MCASVTISDEKNFHRCVEGASDCYPTLHLSVHKDSA